MDKLITVFTPTYNRKEYLERCYQSLIKQNNKNFTWVIIDDGSKDGTGKKVKEWMDEGVIDIKYIYKSNEGKAAAINLSLEKCDTKLWFCLDSDDYLTRDAIDIIENNYSKIKEDPGLCGMMALRTTPSGEIMNKKERLPKNLRFATLNSVLKEKKYRTETALIFKTEIIKQYKFPRFEGEKFIPMGYIYDKLDVNYKYYILHYDLMISEYLNDGITKNKRKLIQKNPKGYNLHQKQRIELTKNHKEKIKAVLLYNISCLLDSDTNIKIGFKESPDKMRSLVLFPISWLFYKYKYK